MMGTGMGLFFDIRFVPSEPNLRSPLAGDFNGDGVADLAFVNGDTTAGRVTLLLGRGDGSFPARLSFPVGPSPRAVRAADFDGDGNLDVAVSFFGGVRVLRNHGHAGLGLSHVSYFTDNFPQQLTAEDFTGDGLPDLAVTNGDSNSVSILLNDGVWPGPGPSPGGSRSPRGGTVPATLDGFAAEILASRLGVPAGAATLPLAEFPWTAIMVEPVRGEGSPQTEFAMEFRSAVVSRRGADDFFAHEDRELDGLNYELISG